MNKLKTLFKPNVKTSSEELRQKCGSDNLDHKPEDHWSAHSFVEDSNAKEFPSINASAPTINYDDIQFTSSSDLDDDHSSNESQEFMIHSRKRKSPEQIRQHYNDYHREYLKNYRLRKKTEEAQMKELYQLAINALINVLNANSKIISEDIKANINNTIDYNDQCRKIINLTNELYKSSSE